MGKIFWIKIAAVLIGLLAMHIAMLPFVDGNTSITLSKVSNGQHKHLVIGTSRIAQAVQPKTLEETTNRRFLNFAIDAATTSYSESYNRAIEKIIPTDCKDGIFILAMDPWTITSFHNPVNGEVMEPEKEATLSKQITITNQLNLEYLIRDFRDGWGQILLTYLRSNSTVVGHDDGWIEVTRPDDADFVSARMAKKIKAKRKEMAHAFISEERKKALESLLLYLKPLGQIYFVRLPVDPEYLELEQELHPHFDAFVDSLQKRFQIPYYDMQRHSSEVVFNDGHHINKAYAPAMSKLIAEWIMAQANSQKP